MKMKVILSIILIVIIVFIIYTLNVKSYKYYFNIMDSKNNYKTYNVLIDENIDLDKSINYIENDYRVTDLIRDINDNTVIGNKKIQNILIKANIVTLMIGNNQLENQFKNIDMTEMFDYSNSLLDDIDILFKLIRKYCKEKVFFIGFYNNNEYYDEIYKYINLRIKDMCDIYNIIYIDRENIFNEKENRNIYEKIVSNI